LTQYLAVPAALQQDVPFHIATLATPLFSFARATRGMDARDARVFSVPQAQAYTAIVQLKDFASHKLWRDGRLIHTGGHARHTMALTDQTQNYACQHLSSFDNVRIQLDQPRLDKLSDELTGKRLYGLQSTQNVADPVMNGLVQALLPLLQQREHADAIFVEHVMIAIAVHLMRRYGGQQDLLLHSAKGCRMAAQQECRAKDYMVAHLAYDFTLEDVARHCGMSRAAFARAFRKRLGMTPFEWVRSQRVERAKLLLLDKDLSLADIAAECGFADQSHFTRVFTRLVGVGPRAWQHTVFN
jgi:AraC family transcriptional regulator